MQLTITYDGRGTAIISAASHALATNKAQHVYRRAINHAGDKTTTQVKRSLVKQTGLAFGKVSAALSQKRASFGGLEYRISGSGKHFGLKDFKARVTGKGVSAAPWNTRRLFRSTFFGPGGQVFRRVSAKRLPIEKLWGPSIPREMVRDQTRQAFERTVAAELPRRVEHELSRIMP